MAREGGMCFMSTFSQVSGTQRGPLQVDLCWQYSEGGGKKKDTEVTPQEHWTPLLRPLACLFPFIALQSPLYRVCGPIQAVWSTFLSVNSLHPMVPARGLLTVGDFSTCSFALIMVVDSAQNSPLISPVSPIKILFIFSLPAMHFFLKTGTVAA